ncbi:uncharacterized protein EI97DRAFT_123084 [Westerdykella ornata]|uniref:Serine-rich protein n=1 Tax=Westerdykella ornata TaxID=318751 RepID=A0A6A6JW43_WESOR|nr:uncharacterized protein EI97DRAFT_123084 [Westerdykella ornata]KAF2280434.1 hypothetical protein EI97DRAFT_123084 [Westerdykella ornata]
MSSGAEQRTTASKPRTVSPFENAPILPPPSSRTTSPRRRPLHERSNSRSNQIPAPTIRVVEDAEEPSSDIYSKSPFPSRPSQILPPRKRPGYAFEGRGARVSDSTFVAHAVAKIEANNALVPKPLQPKKGPRQSTSTNNSDTDTVVGVPFSPSFSPSSSRFSQVSTAPSSVFPEETGLEILQEEASPPRQSTIRAVPPSTSSSDEPSDGHALTPRASAISFASTASSDSLPHPEDHREPDSFDKASPASQDREDTPSSGSDTSKQASSSPNVEVHRPVPRASSESIQFSDSSYTSERPRSSSQPAPSIHAARHVILDNGVRLSYPVVRPPSVSGLWAESRPLPKNPSRMNPRTSVINQWSSQLSTIPSESERASRSIERQSQSIDERSHSTGGFAQDGRSNVPRRRQTISSISSSDNDNGSSHNSNKTESSAVVPLPLFSPITKQPSEERTSDELQDTIAPLQSPPLRTKRSFLKRRDSDSRSSSSRPSSAQSDFSTFIANNIPAWARVYYQRGENIPASYTESTDSLRLPTSNSGRTNTPSETHFPMNIYRPRNRPHQRISQPDSISISEAPEEQQRYAVGPPRRPMSEIFTPRLQKDRRSTARLSAWKAPSLDESLGTLFFSRQNRQILLFCLGFLFPFAWMIAAFLPLPPDPLSTVEATPSQLELERQLTKLVEDRSYQKAMWWRNLNRIMAAVGTLLIGVIIALAILASRMS